MTTSWPSANGRMPAEVSIIQPLRASPRWRAASVSGVSPDRAGATMKSFDSKTSPAPVAFGPLGGDGLPDEGAGGSPETAGSVRVDAQPAAASSAAAMMTNAIREGCRRAEDVPVTALHPLRALLEILGSRPLRADDSEAGHL